MLDPKYLEEKKKNLNAIKPTMASDSEITNNLGKFANRRSDIFGTEEKGIGRSIEEEEPVDTSTKIIWDGETPLSKLQQQGTGKTVQEQIAAIHAKKNLPIEESSKLGPVKPQFSREEDEQTVPPTKKQKSEEKEKKAPTISVTIQLPTEAKGFPKVKGATLIYTIAIDEPISKIKEKIEKETNVPIDRQVLKAKSILEKDTKTFEEYKLTSDTKLTFSISK